MRLDKRKYDEASPLKVVWPQNPAGTTPHKIVNNFGRGFNMFGVLLQKL
jgi:hypothetical protein